MRPTGPRNQHTIPASLPVLMPHHTAPHHTAPNLHTPNPFAHLQESWTAHNNVYLGTAKLKPLPAAYNLSAIWNEYNHQVCVCGRNAAAPHTSLLLSGRVDQRTPCPPTTTTTTTTPHTHTHTTTNTTTTTPHTHLSIRSAHPTPQELTFYGPAGSRRSTTLWRLGNAFLRQGFELHHRHGDLVHQLGLLAAADQYKWVTGSGLGLGLGLELGLRLGYMCGFVHVWWGGRGV